MIPLDELARHLAKPPLYAPGTGSLWDDDHVSKGMLAAHLDPFGDAASRNHAFLDASVTWIATLAPPAEFPRLLDLGCGPGLYAMRFAAAGYEVTGVDVSRRSIAYAQAQAEAAGRTIDYRCQDYRSLDEVGCYDVVTLLFCDYAALSAADRRRLVIAVRRALRDGGQFVLDVFTERMRQPEHRSWQVCPDGGFFSERPYVCLHAVYQYADFDATELRQDVVVTEHGVQDFRVWDHFFNPHNLAAEIRPAGFRAYQLFGDAAGGAWSENNETLCEVFTV